MDTLIQILFRGGLPLVLMWAVAFGMKKQGKDAKQIRGVFFVGFIWGIVGAATLIYEIPSWSIWLQIAVHFILMLVTVYPLLLLSGWFKVQTIQDYFKVFLVFLAFGVVFAFLGWYSTYGI